MRGNAVHRQSIDNSRSCDETYFLYNSHGDSSGGTLPTDRPNTLKGYAYYDFKWLKKFTKDIGLFQTIYQGSPISSYVDVGEGFNAFPVYPENRGMCQNLTQDPTTGVITPVGVPFARPTPFYNQTDLNIKQSYNIGESKTISFDATITNLLNQRAVTAYTESVGSQNGSFKQCGYSSEWFCTWRMHGSGDLLADLYEKRRSLLCLGTHPGEHTRL